jgi:hypothetical protein
MTRVLTIALTMLLAGLASSALSQSEKPESKPIEFAKAVSILKISKDQDRLLEAALAVCRSSEPKALEILLGFLQDPSFWLRLDSERDNANASAPYLAAVVQAIGQLGTARAEEALLQLGKDKMFLQSRGRLLAAVDAAQWINKPSAKLIAFVESSAALEQGSSNGAVYVLSKLKTPEACSALVRLLEKPLLAATTGNGNRIWSLVHELFPIRNDPAVVAFYGKLFRFQGMLKDERVRNIMVQTLFDYRPMEWSSFDPNFDLEPPSRQDASTEVLKELLKLADVAGRMDLSNQTKQGVEEAKKEIAAIWVKRPAK